MRELSDLLTLLSELQSLSTEYNEEPARVRIAGNALNPSVRETLHEVLTVCQELGVSAPIIRCANETLDYSDLTSARLDGEAWVVFLGKGELASSLNYRADENKYLFLSMVGFNKWVEKYDPFLFEKSSQLKFDSKVTIIIVGLESAFGNENVWFIPYGTEPSSISFNETDFPTSSDVYNLVRTNSSDGIRLCPEFFSITWGEYRFESSLPLVRKLSEVMVSCLAQEIKRVDGRYLVTIRGAKKVNLELSSPVASVSHRDFDNIMNAVRWVYSERAETRLQLITDRLSIDSNAEKCFLINAIENIDFALLQAKDSYAFVILDRKDAYFKELREIMKDMKSQADLYAAKVRDLIGALARDVLGVLLFVSMSFVGKFDRAQIKGLLASDEAGLMLKCISIYLFISCFATLAIHWRDATLSYRESRTWLTILQQYSSRDDRTQRFIEPLTSRLLTLIVAGSFTALIYIILSIIVWNLQFVVELLLSQ